MQAIPVAATLQTPTHTHVSAPKGRHRVRKNRPEQNDSVRAAVLPVLTKRADEALGIFKTTGRAIAQFFEETTPPPKQLGLNKVPLPSKISLDLKTQGNCLQILDSVCGLKIILLRQIKLALEARPKEELVTAERELKDAMKQVEEMSALCKHIQDSYPWAGREPDVQKNYWKSLSQIREASSLKAAVIDLLRTKVDYPAPVGAAATGKSAVNTADKLYDFMNNFRCTSFGAGLSLGVYCYSGSLKSAIFMIAGAGDYFLGAKKSILKEAGEIGKSMFNDAASVALPFSAALASTAFVCGKKELIYPIILGGTGLQTYSFVNSKIESFNFESISKASSVALLSLTKKWFKSGVKTGAIAVGATNIYSYGFGVVNPLNWKDMFFSSAALYLIHLAGAKAIEYAEK